MDCKFKESEQDMTCCHSERSEESRHVADVENTSAPVSAPWLWTAWVTALIAAIGLIAANLIFGNLNQDEGWYLYAAGLVSSGKMPYRDFAFTQGPAMPYFYALFYQLIEWGGLVAGRIITAVVGIAGAAFAATLAGRLSMEPGRKTLAALLCFTLISVNVYQSYFCTVVKTYSLTIFFLMSALLTLHYALTHRKAFALMLAAALLVLASGTRSSAAVVLPVIFGLLLWERKKFAFPAWIYFASGGIIAAIFVFGPFLLQCASNFIYFVISYHALRHEGDFLTAMMFKAGFVSRVIQAYFVGLVFWVAAVIFKLGFANGATAHDSASCHPESRLSRDRDEGSHLQLSIRQRFLVALGMTIYAGCNLMSVKPGDQDAVVASFLRRCIWFSALAVSLVHFIAPFPYDDYQVFVYPLFAVAVSVMILEAVPARAGKGVVLTALGLTLMASVSSPINQDWFIEGRELIWWRAKDKPALVKLQQTAEKIRALGKPGELLLTQDPYLAVESGRALPSGLEMGQFSYFPDLTEEQAKKLNVLNRGLFADLLQNCNAPLAAISGYAFAIQSPQITPLSSADKALFEQIISSRYELFETVANFGQASTDLRLYRRK